MGTKCFCVSVCLCVCVSVCLCVCVRPVPDGLSPQWDICQEEPQIQHLTFTEVQATTECTHTNVVHCPPFFSLSFFSALTPFTSIQFLLFTHFSTLASTFYDSFSQPPLLLCALYDSFSLSQSDSLWHSLPGAAISSDEHRMWQASFVFLSH